MNIVLDRSGRTPLYLQIRNALREMIINGMLAPGYRLPPERKLAATLEVNRSTVVKAYEELAADGLIESFVGRGTIVAGTPGAGTANACVEPPLRWTHLFNRESARTSDPLISNLLNHLGQDDMINLAAGAPAPELYPTGDIAQISADIMAASGHQMLEYSSPQGLLSLRTCLAEYMHQRGISSGPDDIIVTSGSQQGLELAARIMLEPGDNVLVEEPSYPGALQVFRAAGARLVGVPRDRSGLRLEVLEQAMLRYRPKLFYTMPTYQNPAGTNMDEAQRRSLLEIAYRCHVPIIEDDAYSEISFDEPPVPPLAALDRFGLVLYLSTFSKMLFPGMRIGWAAGPGEVIRQMVLARQLDDIHSVTLAQEIVTVYCQRGLLQGHLVTIRQEYNKRREAMLEALRQFAPPGMLWDNPPGGFYVWCRLPAGVTGERLLSVCRSIRVGFVPGSAFHADAGGSDHIRLSFSRCEENEIRIGIERICRAVRQISKEAGGIGERNKTDDMAPLALL
ncbi:MAG: PLP-dependent aminotransferase family protein [Syntrophomonadaceae bacterium]|nr:PLP-dependent aminotransferase family protein [Syntrophomonadaceae bacterium]